jgi:hypothetical protein
VEVTEQYQVKISDRFAPLDNLDDDGGGGGSQRNGYSLNNVRHETNRTLRNKKKQ